MWFENYIYGYVGMLKFCWGNAEYVIESVWNAFETIDCRYAEIKKLLNIWTTSLDKMNVKESWFIYIDNKYNDS